MQPELPIKPCLFASYNLQLEPTLYPPGRNKSTRSSRHRNTAEDLHIKELPMVVREQGSSDRISRQPSKCHTQENSPVPDPNLSDR